MTEVVAAKKNAIADTIGKEQNVTYRSCPNEDLIKINIAKKMSNFEVRRIKLSEINVHPYLELITSSA